VDDEQILGIMPAFEALSDDDMAAVLTYLSGLDHAPVAFTAEEIRGARDQPRQSPTDIAAQRTRLNAAKIIP
jgi:mono/diheme cytochrome c family protein